MLTCERLALAAGHFADIAGTSASKRVSSEPAKIQSLGTTVKFWGIIWLGKLYVVPEAVIDKSAYSTPNNMKETNFCSDFEIWRCFIPTWHGTSVLHTGW